MVPSARDQPWRSSLVTKQNCSRAAELKLIRLARLCNP
jgi:hypothetical protein